MKIEDAIARINEIKIEIDNWRDSLGEKLSERDVIDIQAYDIALQALEKQIPKEPKRMGYVLLAKDGWEYECPVCKVAVGTNKNAIDYTGQEKHCPGCGQALKWGE